MPEKVDPAVRLRTALEDLEAEENPDDFCRLIAAVLAAPGDPYAVLCAAAWGRYVPGEMSFFEDWASGRVAPAPLMRTQVIRFVRHCFRDGELLLRDKEQG